MPVRLLLLVSGILWVTVGSAGRPAGRRIGLRAGSGQHFRVFAGPRAGSGHEFFYRVFFGPTRTRPDPRNAQVYPQSSMLTHLRATLSIHTNLEFPQPPTCVPCLPVSEPIDAGKDQQLPAISHDYQLFTFEIPIDQRWRRDASTARNHQRQTNPTGTNNFLGTTAAGAIAGRTQPPSLLCFRNEREKKETLSLKFQLA